MNLSYNQDQGSGHRVVNVLYTGSCTPDSWELIYSNNYSLISVIGGSRERVLKGQTEWRCHEYEREKCIKTKVVNWDYSFPWHYSGKTCYFPLIIQLAYKNCDGTYLNWKTSNNARPTFSFPQNTRVIMIAHIQRCLLTYLLTFAEHEIKMGLPPATHSPKRSAVGNETVIEFKQVKSHPLN